MYLSVHISSRVMFRRRNWLGFWRKSIKPSDHMIFFKQYFLINLNHRATGYVGVLNKLSAVWVITEHHIVDHFWCIHIQWMTRMMFINCGWPTSFKRIRQIINRSKRCDNSIIFIRSLPFDGHVSSLPVVRFYCSWKLWQIIWLDRKHKVEPRNGLDRKFESRVMKLGN